MYMSYLNTIIYFYHFSSLVNIGKYEGKCYSIHIILSFTHKEQTVLWAQLEMEGPCKFYNFNEQ